MTRSQKRVVVTGVNGFVGGHLVRELNASGHEVTGIGLQSTTSVIGLNAYISQDISLGWPHLGDVDAVVHLAGLSSVGSSFGDPQSYLTRNSAMITNICEWMLQNKAPTRLVVVSSGAVYDSAQSMPLSESSRIGFSSPYVVSKVLVENQSAYYTVRGLDIVVARPFNHIGPGQGPGFLLPDLCEAAEKARRTGRPLSVGRLSTRRDYTDVRDVVRAYRDLALTESLEHRVFNVCSGRAWSGMELLDMLRSNWKFGELETTEDPGKLRPEDPTSIVGSCERVMEQIGWRANISVETSVRDFVNEWYQRR